MSSSAPTAPPREDRAQDPRPAPRDPLHRSARYYRVPTRRRGRILAPVWWTIWMILGLVLGVLATGYTVLEETIEQASPDIPEVNAAIAASDPVVAGEPVTLLLIGSDTRPEDGEDMGRSDSLILVRMDGEAGFISMLSFPRDLYVEIPGYGSDKINAAYTLGGPAATIETVKALTGQPINYYVNIDFDGFRRLVDEVGGVYIDVDRRYFNDNSQSGEKYEEIDLKPGYQKLGGEDALDFVRYRHTDSDFARIARQQQFLSELKRQTARFGNLFSIPSFVRIFGGNVQTSIRSQLRLLELAGLALTVDKERVARFRIEGYDDMLGEQAIVRALPGELETKVEEWRDPSFVAGGAAVRIDPPSVTVDVRNGSGRLLASQDLAAALRERRFDAHAVGNAERLGLARTAVFYGARSREAAKAIQALLPEGATIAPSPQPLSAGTDVVVVAGEDFDGTLPRPVRDEQTRQRPDTFDSDGVVPILQRVEVATELRTVAPLKLPRNSRLRIVRPYRVNTGGTGPWALKLVFDIGGGNYWGMTQTRWANPPILDGRTGVVRSGGREYFTYYDGKNLQRLAWQKDGMTYWISNTLDYKLSDETMYAIAKSARELPRARLPEGAVDTEIQVEIDGYTP